MWSGLGDAPFSLVHLGDEVEHGLDAQLAEHGVVVREALHHLGVDRLGGEGRTQILHEALEVLEEAFEIELARGEVLASIIACSRARCRG